MSMLYWLVTSSPRHLVDQPDGGVEQVRDDVSVAVVHDGSGVLGASTKAGRWAWSSGLAQQMAPLPRAA
ncbi:hypothetical protein [Streptomyces sp. V4I2]|uniref:hypothetical protein n=1 Tax=Streptomyces sp. V4I2 TaxID=3042280 RepID=UPI00278B1870|nr:hypothetical protein [Streptomyces sp. V4I2]MDQ1050805.1 hypothetical protein [Streptomyces sp. V4I2]